MNRHTAWLKRFARLPVLLLATLGVWGESLAAAPTEPGRLFYTPEQRALLEAARTRNVTQVKQASPEAGPAPVRFDGMVVRSDGTGTRWVNGRPQVGTSGVADLKPGQIRADGRVYEPYQVLRPSPAPSITKEPTP
jgi:hypothetical protein